MERTRPSRVRWVVLGVVILGFVAWRLAIGLIPPKLEFGPQTTVVTGPKTPDGRIDYAAALHLRFSEGIHPEENAAVLMNEAFGPGQISAELRSQYFHWLKTEPLPEKGDYVLTQGALIQRKLAARKSESDSMEGDTQSSLTEAMLKEFSRAQSRPWTRDECPLAAEWLDANAGPLELITQAAKRSQYYSPLVTTTGLVEGENNSQNLREAARLLTTRAMFRIADNDVTGAWNDLLTCHRLARLASRHAGTSIQMLITVAVESAAVGGDTALLSHGVSAGQARKCLSDLAELPDFAVVADVIDQGDRLGSVEAILQQSPQLFIDLNMMLRQANAVYDDVVAALKHAAHADRRKALEALGIDLKQRSTAANQPFRQAVAAVTLSRRMVTESIGTTLLGMLIPSISITDVATTRRQIRCDEVRIGFALTAYRATEGTYPKSLDELVPRYLDVVPLDRFTEKPLVYVPRDSGYLLYSIGANNRDDAGKNGGPEKADDVMLEIPVKWD